MQSPARGAGANEEDIEGVRLAKCSDYQIGNVDRELSSDLGFGHGQAGVEQPLQQCLPATDGFVHKPFNLGFETRSGRQSPSLVEAGVASGR